MVENGFFELNKQVWPAERIRGLRLRMGWSRAELARYIQTNLSLVVFWESGQASPEAEHASRLQVLENQVDSYSEKLQRLPVAESLMSTMSLAQIHDSTVVEISLQRKSKA